MEFNWMDLKVGDFVWIGGTDCGFDVKGDCEILEIDADDEDCPIRVIDSSGDDTSWPSVRTRKMRFIRRP